MQSTFEKILKDVAWQEIDFPEDGQGLSGDVENKLKDKIGGYKKRIAELRKKYVYAFGHSSNIGAQYISDILNRDSESHQNKQQKN